MQAIQLPPTAGLRRWCRECGLPSPVSASGCVNCGELPTRSRTARILSPVFNEGNGMVQNNVLNIDAAGLIDALSDEPEPVPPKPSLLYRVFMLTCTLAMWCGILTFVTIVSVILYCVVLAVMKAHG